MKKVVLLYGGTSTERDVSLSSRKCIHDALCELGYKVTDLDPANGVLNMVSVINDVKPDCVFCGLYGGSGENGEVQSLLNMMKIPYTHSGVAASCLSMDKSLSAKIFKEFGIPHPETCVMDISNIRDYKKYPFVIKPISGGSSIGVFIINSERDLDNLKWEYGDRALVQEYIPGRELAVGVCNGKALAVTEIVPKSGFYDYKTKYSNGMADHVLPAEIDAKATEKIMRYAELAYKHLGCRGIARADFRYDEQKSGIYILEMNTQPGMTELSLFPEQARYRGVSFKELIGMLVDQACYDL